MSIPIIDPYGVVDDDAMPTLGAALDPVTVQTHFARKLKQFIGPEGCLSLHGIEVARHKPGRRCVIEYDVSVARPAQDPEQATLIGKVRARRFGKSGYRMLKALWEAGFQMDSADGISVPEPIGTVGKLQMWLQRKVPGQLATELLATDGAPALGRRIAEAAHKLHESAIDIEATHSMDKELRILHERLPHVYQADPRLRRRIEQLLRACDELGSTTRTVSLRPIHRDFYSDQIIVDHDRLYLLDFDLCCNGDPAVDIGNFLGHITEQSIRELGSADALKPVEDCIEQRFNELAGGETQTAVRVYRILTLVRHIYLSTVIPERRHLTAQLVDLCEAHFTGIENGVTLAR